MTKIVEIPTKKYISEKTFEKTQNYKWNEIFRTTMARMKQTARNSTRDKALRKQLATKSRPPTSLRPPLEALRSPTATAKAPWISARSIATKI